MPLKPETNYNFQQYYATIFKMNQLMSDLSKSPKKLVWNLADPFQRINLSIQQLFERIDVAYQYTHLIKTEEKQKMLETHSFISVLFFYFDGHRTLSEDHTHFSIKPYSEMYLIQDEIIQPVIENLTNIIEPAKGLILISKAPVLTQLMSDKSPGFNRAHMTLNARKDATLAPLISQAVIQTFNRHPMELSVIMAHLLSNEPKKLNMLEAYAPALSEDLVSAIANISLDLDPTLSLLANDLAEAYIALLLVYYIRLETSTQIYEI